MKSCEQNKKENATVNRNYTTLIQSQKNKQDEKLTKKKAFILYVLPHTIAYFGIT